MKPPPLTSPRRSRPPRHSVRGIKLALGFALGLTIGLPLAVMAAGDAHMELNPLMPNPPPFTTNLAPYESSTVYITVTTPPEFTLISGPHVANPRGSANVLWTALGSGYTIVNTAPYKDWSRLEVSASWVKTNAPGGGVASGGSGENYDRFASALANLDHDWGIVWSFNPPVGQPVGAPINWTVAAFDSAGNPLACSFSNVAGTGIHPAAYAGSWTVTAGTPASSSLSGTVVSDDPSLGKLKANYSYAFGSGTHSADQVLTFLKLTLLSVDASNPTAAKAKYRLEPDSVSGSAHFNVRGTNATRLVSGTFDFFFDQTRLLDEAGEPMNLLVESDAVCELNVTIQVDYRHVSAQELLTTYFLFEGVGLKTYVHKLNELYKVITYPVEYSGKTWELSAALVTLGIGTHPITGGESHKYSFQTAYQAMPDCGAVISGESPYCKRLTTGVWVAPSIGIKGLAKNTGLIWHEGGMVSPAMGTVNSEVDVEFP